MSRPSTTSLLKEGRNYKLGGPGAKLHKGAPPDLAAVSTDVKLIKYHTPTTHG